MADERDEIEGQDEQEESVPTEQERRRIQRDARKSGSGGVGNMWMKGGGVQGISYTPPDGVRSRPEMIRAGDLVVDPRYNRDISHKWVEEIAANFNPDQLQTLNVSRRLYRMVQRSQGKPKEEQVFDGILSAANRVEIVVISGQHRLLATLKARGPDFLLSCNVYDGLTESQEAELFALWDEKVRPHQPWQRHRAHLFGGNPEAVEIDKIVRDSGMVLYTGKQAGNADGVIYAVSTVYSIRRYNGSDFLRRVLEIHFSAWTDNQEGYTAPMLQGTALLMRRFGVYAMWQDEYLALALSDPAHNPLSIRQRATGAASGISSTSIAQEVARLEHRYYQQGKKGYQRLPDWNATPRDITAASDAAIASRSKTGGSGPSGTPRRRNGDKKDGEPND